MPSISSESTRLSARQEAVRDFCHRPHRSIKYPKSSTSPAPYRDLNSSDSNVNNEKFETILCPSNISEYFASDVFTLARIKDSVSPSIYTEFISQMRGDKLMERGTADAIAEAAKNWAMAKGATHFTHWFQPLTNGTAEKHDSFLGLDYSSEAGSLLTKAIDEFSGPQLMQAEPDASSFPNGGMRCTFEARGYTVWDTTSPMFVREGPHDTKTLYIPSVFISYNGDALDEKTILLRSTSSVSKEVLKMLSLIGDKKTKNVHLTLGTEQEFFLVDRGLYSQRPDLKLTGRTLLGDVPTKHQQLDDHYFGHIPSKVLATISEAELELWKLGVPVKTRHNEVAPKQFEMAPIFEEVSVSVDHNLLTMNVLSKVAHRHGLKILFHEKPFAGMNGSGKHCNWSVCTDSGENLLEPGKEPENNPPFLLMLGAILLGLKKHSGLLSASIASSSNEHRLGGHEAPPSIISAFLGSQLAAIVESIASTATSATTPTTPTMIPKTVYVGSKTLNVNVPHLPKISKDTTDRNRTSPFAFTGNKFEFRAVGSSQSPSFPVTMVNAATASGLKDINRMLEEKLGANGSVVCKGDIMQVLKKVFKDAQCVCFEGDGYSEAWVQEAKLRGLPNLPHAPDAFKQLILPHNRNMLVGELGIFSALENDARFMVLCEKYVKDTLIEAKTLRSICKQIFLPSIFKYRQELANGIKVIEEVSCTTVSEEKVILKTFNESSSLLYKKMNELEKGIKKIEEKFESSSEESDDLLSSNLVHASDDASKYLVPLMDDIRKITDEIEYNLADDYYPMPKYAELLWS